MGDQITTEPYNRWIEENYSDEFHAFHWHVYDGSLPMREGYEVYVRLDDNICQDTKYYWRYDIYTYTFKEYKYVYTYTYTKTEESTTYPSGNNVSNIQTYVKYIPK